ncbi:DUF7551 domain-containing protein [Haloarchaeobius iranensis]|uniref:Uncharacterized protein n=1 Tax=Haloarchaeobius iranensis TaxID=996166 RepID=A0A1G9YJ89_9EURY|nr:hypothetical protein [Haloarchaeobius iranensis]SDN08515.1 hypothetical protein SAMN05192554_11478 [Haloarchaeobius iranensis]
MIGTTLGDIRSQIEALASDDGAYYLACARYGDRPVPAAGLRFESRAVARTAARATEQYRAALRRYDPRLPYYDIIVRRDPTDTDAAPAADAAVARVDEGGPTPRSDAVFGSSGRGSSARVDFCHRIAAAVFETLSEAGHDPVETAVMDAYLDLAETVTDPDELCLCLLESMASEVERRLSPAEQAAVVTAAAERLPTPASTGHPVPTTLASLERRDLLGGRTWSPPAAVPGTETRSVVVRLSEYALRARDGRLPVLPVVVELARRDPERVPASLDVTDGGDGWWLRVVLDQDERPNGLVNAAIRSSP